MQFQAVFWTFNTLLAFKARHIDSYPRMHKKVLLGSIKSFCRCRGTIDHLIDSARQTSNTIVFNWMSLFVGAGYTGKSIVFLWLLSDVSNSFKLFDDCNCFSEIFAFLVEFCFPFCLISLCLSLLIMAECLKYLWWITDDAVDRSTLFY